MRAVVFILGLTAAAAEPVMSLIPRGSFQMGRSKLTSDDKTNMRPHILLDDRPVHTVEIDAFWLDTHEATHAQYAEYLKAKKLAPPYHWRGDEMPAELAKIAIYNVNWEEARGYCEFRGKRLPTEAEWERAARGGEAIRHGRGGRRRTQDGAD